MTDDLPDALAEALGGIISDLRKEWKKELEIIGAESRATIAELKATIADLTATLRESASDQVKRVDAALANVRDGEDVDHVMVERTITEHVYAAVEAVEKNIRIPQDGKSVEPEVIERMVADAVAAAVAMIRVPEDGKSVEIEVVKAMVDEAVAGIRVPEDGKSVEIEVVKAMVDEAVAAVPPAEPGKSVTMDDVQPVIDEIKSQIAAEHDAEFRKSVEAMEARIESQVADRVERAVQAIPPAEPGKSVTVDDVRPIIEFSVKELAERFGADMSEKAQALRAEVEAAIKAIPEVRDGESVTLDQVQPVIDDAVKSLRDEVFAEADTVKGALTEDVNKAIAAIRVPEDGKSVTLDQVQPVIDSAVEKAVTERVEAMVKPVLAELDTETITGNIKVMVEEAVATIPVPKDGDSVTLDQVQPLIDKAVTDAVKAIPVPKDAADIADALIDRDGNLVLTLTDGRMKSLGLVVGRSVDQDAVTQSITELVQKAVDAIPKPKDGDDGLGFDDMSVEHDGERAIILRWSRGDLVKEAKIEMPFVLDQGVYKAERNYVRGDGVTWGGSYWIAQVDTNEKPGDGVKSWRLAVKRGQDGNPVVRAKPKDGPFKLPRAE